MVIQQESIMGLPQRLLSGLALCVLTVPAFAQTPRGAAPPRAEREEPLGLATVVPELNFQGVALDDAIRFLQDMVPSFRAVVMREPGVPAGYPELTIRLRKVEVGQVLSLIQSGYPEVEIKPIDSKSGTVQCIIVRASDRIQNRGKWEKGPPGGVRIYRLTGAVESLVAANPETAAKDAVNQVLSLMKAALDQGGKADGAPVLQIHEQTQTLIFKGSAEQRACLEDVLAALDANASREERKQAEWNERLAEAQRQLQLEKARGEEALLRLRDDLQEMRRRLQDQERIAMERAVEVERLKVRLEAERKGPNPKPADAKE
jgi:hypothetical protein